MSCAPIALFAYKRPVHLRRALEALARNPAFAHSPLHVFCDGPRRADEATAVQATREVARQWLHPAKVMHESPTHRGLAASVIDGVGRLCATAGRVIVVEDDLVVAPTFLDFMNAALDRYADAALVMQVSGHMFPVDLPTSGSDAVFLPFVTSWGWATWEHAWRHFDPAMPGFDRLVADPALRRRFDLGDAYPYFSMLKKQRAGQVDSWAIRWYLSVFMRDGLTLYPRRSLVSNEGFDGSGTHGGPAPGAALQRGTALAGPAQAMRWPDACVDARAFAGVTAWLRSQNTFWQRAGRHLARRLAWHGP